MGKLAKLPHIFICLKSKGYSKSYDQFFLYLQVEVVQKAKNLENKKESTKIKNKKNLKF